MQAVSVQTTQNINLEFPLADVGSRLLAFLIDLVIMISFIFLVVAFFGIFQVDPPNWMVLIFVIVAYLYRFFSELLWNGQTVGKNLLKIKVVKLDGSQPSVAAYFLRWLVEPIDFFLVGMAVILILLTKNGQRAGDLLAGTTVIKVKRVTATNVRNKMIMKQVDEDYEPTYPQAANISDADIRIIKDGIKAFREDAAKQAVQILEAKLKEKYQIESDKPTVDFLYTLLRDHTYYVAR